MGSSGTEKALDCTGMWRDMTIQLRALETEKVQNISSGLSVSAAETKSKEIRYHYMAGRIKPQQNKKTLETNKNNVVYGTKR